MGDNVTVAPNVVVRDSDMHSVGGNETKQGSVNIGPDTWTGTGTTILTVLPRFSGTDRN
jgi:acetyltransferase-like isoleucine patch superfamily enzyme